VDLKNAGHGLPIPIPDMCVHHDWNPIAAGPGQSTVAGVLAGVAFLALTVILTVARESGERAAADQALKLLFVSFLGLGVAAYLLADLGGEQACPRANLEEELAGAILGTFAIVMMSALTWLVAACRQEDASVLNFMRWPVYVACAFVVLLLGTNSVGTLNTALNYGSHAAVSWALYIATGAAAFVAGAKVWRLERAAGSGQAEAGSGTPADRRVSDFARAALVYLAISTVASGVVIGTPARLFYPTPPWAAYTSAWATLVLPAVILLLAIRGLARPEPDPVDARACGTGWPS
jgi:hypothetical protein